jgi:hypothetical protein
MLCFLQSLLAVAVFLFSASAARAEAQTIELGGGVRIDVPEGWRVEQTSPGGQNDTVPTVTIWKPAGDTEDKDAAVALVTVSKVAANPEEMRRMRSEQTLSPQAKAQAIAELRTHIRWDIVDTVYTDLVQGGFTVYHSSAFGKNNGVYVEMEQYLFPREAALSRLTHSRPTLIDQETLHELRAIVESFAPGE